MPLRWKVGGITRLDDAIAAVEAGADAVGFVFLPDDARSIEAGVAAEISAALPRTTWRFGAFGDVDIAAVAATIDAAGLDFVELIGCQAPRRCRSLGRHAFKVLQVQDDDEASRLEKRAEAYPECTLHVRIDHEPPRQESLRWRAVVALARRHRLMVGGDCIGESCLDEIVNLVRPWAVDADSSVEKAPGIKDHRLLAGFGKAIQPFR